MEYEDTPPRRRAAGQRPTLEMVAARAGVSRGTASRVLSGASNVSPQAVAAVRAAAAELRYRPNVAARNLVTGRSDLIGLLVNQDPDRVWADPFYQQFTNGAHETLSKAGIALVLAMGRDPGQRDSLIELATSRLDGVLVTRSPGDDDLVAALIESDVPCCFVGYPGDAYAERSSSVSFDNVVGARVAVAHLVERGRSTIATITGPLDNSASVERLDGWGAELGERGLPHGDDLVVTGDWGSVSGHDAMTELLARHPEIDGVLCANDLMAFGAMRAISDSGREVPTDVSVVGMGGFLAEEASPSLTSLRLDVRETGRRVAQLLLTQIASHAPTTHERIPMVLEIRDSS